MVLDEIDFNVIPMEPGTIIIKNEDKVLTACSFIQITGKAKTCKTVEKYIHHLYHIYTTQNKI